MSSLSTRARNSRPDPVRLQIEALEDRAVPAITVPTAGSPGPVTVTGTDGADQFRIRLATDTTTPTLQISDDNGSTFTDVAVSDVTRITVDGLDGNDTLTIDNSNGLVGNAASGGLAISFDGGDGTDRLVLSGNPTGAAVNETYNFGSTEGAGSITVGNNTTSATVTLTDTEGITDTLTAARLTINATDQRDVLRLVDGDTVNGAATFRLEAIDTDFADDKVALMHRTGSGRNVRIEVGRSAVPAHLAHGDTLAEDQPGENEDGNHFVPITFANKANVTLNLNGGDDFLAVNASTAAARLTGLTVNGGSGFDVVVVRNLASSITPTYQQVERTLTSLDQIFVEELYQFRLHRFADDGGLNNWLGVLNGRGRGAVLDGILRSSEALGGIVDGLYGQLLGRRADAAGREGFANFLRNGGTVEQLIESIVQSQEFRDRAARTGGDGTQQEQLIRTLYLALLDRDPSSQELASAVAAANATSIGALVNGIVHSPEFRRDEVEELYRGFLHRDADQPGLQGWVNSPLDLLSIRFGLMQSDEFFTGS